MDRVSIVNRDCQETWCDSGYSVAKIKCACRYIDSRLTKLIKIRKSIEEAIDLEVE
jgi:hypothetical protein